MTRNDVKFGNTVTCRNLKIENTPNELVDLVKEILQEY